MCAGLLGQRTIPEGLRLPSSSSYYYCWVVAVVVGLFALVVATYVLLFFAAGPSPKSTSVHPPVASSALTGAPIAEKGLLDNDLDNDGQVDSMANSLATSGRSVRGWLDNDLDNDGYPDGMADPLVGLVIVCLLIPSVGGSLLLSLYELPLVGCDYYLPLERPG